MKLWQLDWEFTFTPTHLIAVHKPRRAKFEVPWESVTRVHKVPRPWWQVGLAIKYNQIETRNGRQIPFMPTAMQRYKQFLQELQARAVNCRAFDPYRSEWDRA